jgi:hypothetical protein
MTSRKKKCCCDTCKLIRGMRRKVLPRLDKEGKGIVHELFSRMEIAENDVDWNNAKAKDGERIRLGGRWYVPLQPVRHKKRKGFMNVKIRVFDATRKVEHGQ